MQYKNTNQEIFDKVAIHLLTQNQKSMMLDIDSDQICVYKNPEGLKCAAGILIPDEIYEPEMDKYKFTWDDLINNYKVLQDVGDPEFILVLQRIHDMSEVEHWREHLTELAKDYNLNTDVLK